jgi:hypothetical protein
MDQTPPEINRVHGETDRGVLMSDRGLLLETAEPLPAAMPESPFSRFCETVGPVVDWLLRDGRRIRDTRQFLGELCERLVAQGLPLCRSTFHIRTLHPLILTTGFYWRRDGQGAKLNHREHGIQASPAYLNSPVRIVYEEGRAVRRRLDAPGALLDFPILDELRAEGVTDYLAMPAPFSDGRAACITLATDRRGGFTDAEVEELQGLVPMIGLVLEIQETRRVARTILETYLGPRTGAARGCYAARSSAATPRRSRRCCGTATCAASRGSPTPAAARRCWQSSTLTSSAWRSRSPGTAARS